MGRRLVHRPGHPGRLERAGHAAGTAARATAREPDSRGVGPDQPDTLERASIMGQNHYWDEESFTRIDGASYDAGSGRLTVSFRDGDSVPVSVWRLLRPDQRDP